MCKHICFVFNGSHNGTGHVDVSPIIKSPPGCAAKASSLCYTFLLHHLQMPFLFCFSIYVLKRIIWYFVKDFGEVHHALIMIVDLERGRLMCEKSSSAAKLAAVHGKVASESFNEITHVLQMTFDDPVILVPAQFRIWRNFFILLPLTPCCS